MEGWRNAWRVGFLPTISPLGLEKLRAALTEDDGRIVQKLTAGAVWPEGVTIKDNPELRPDLPPLCACPLGFVGWMEIEAVGRTATVGLIEDYFANVCAKADIHLGDVAACRRFTSWWDDTRRDVSRSLLAAELTYNLGLGPNPIEGQL